MVKPQTVEDIQRALVPDERDPAGLTTEQRRFLAIRERTFSDRSAIDEARLQLVDLYNWRKEPAFIRAYEERAPRITLDDAKRELGQLFFETISIIRNAATGEEVTKSQRWAAERILKAFGLEKLTIESTHTNIPYEARLALEMARRQVALPPAFIDLLLQFYPDDYRRLVDASSPTSQTVDAESVRELPVEGHPPQEAGEA